MSGLAWEDFEKDDYGIIRGGLSGQSGYMPPELYMKKIEQTCMYEREDQLDDYFRSTLKDRTTDQVSLAQDLPRETQDLIRSEIINIRHSAGRTSAEPMHPDLFLGFTDRDTRGCHNSGPDLKLLSGQSKSRVKFKDLRSDHASDWTIASGMRPTSQAIADLRETMGRSKDYLKIFHTSEDSRANVWSGMRTGHVSCLPKTTSDGTILNLNDAQEPGQRSDNKKIREDTIRVGYRQTVDHSFAIAQYGLTTKKQKETDIHASQHKSSQSRKYDIMPSEIQNRLFINMMKEVDRRKHIDDDRDEMNPIFDNSKQARNMIGKMAADLSVAQKSTQRTADTIDLGHTSTNIKMVRIYDPISHDSVVVDKEIFQKVKEAKNISFARKTNPLANREVNTKEGIFKLPGDEVTVMVYSRSTPTNTAPLPVKIDHDRHESRSKPVYKQNHSTSTIMDYSYTEAEQGVNPHADAVFNSCKKGNGYTQGIRNDIDTQSNFDPASDVISNPRKMAGRSRRR